MKIVIAGGSGFLGRALAPVLAGQGHDVVVLTRRPASVSTPARGIAWDPDGTATGDWTREIDGAGAVINLAGESLGDRRWTAARKAVLRESRVDATRSLVAAIRAASTRPATFIQASGMGFYGTSPDQIFDESFPPGSDFLAQLCVTWEAEAHPSTALGCRLAIVRSGVVLARDGGALARLLVPFKFFVGGPIASGRQWFSWIQRDDWVALVVWILNTPSVSGAFNATAPEPVLNADFSRAVGRAIHRPSWLPVPGFALRILVGEFAEDGLIRGQRVIPKHAQDAGFVFRYPQIDAALK